MVQLSLHVLTVDQVKKNLSKVLALFRSGETEPVILGDNRTPEAVIIPFEQFMRLVEHDTDSARDERVFQDEVSRRIAASDAEDSPAEAVGSLEDFFIAEFGDIGREWAAQRKEDDHG